MEDVTRRPCSWGITLLAESRHLYLCWNAAMIVAFRDASRPVILELAKASWWLRDSLAIGPTKLPLPKYLHALPFLSSFTSRHFSWQIPLGQLVSNSVT